MVFIGVEYISGYLWTQNLRKFMLHHTQKSDLPCVRLPPFQEHAKPCHEPGSTAPSNGVAQCSGFHLQEGSGGQWFLKSEHRTVELFLNPLSFGHGVHNNVRFESVLKLNSHHLNLNTVSLNAPICEEITNRINSICVDLFSKGSTGDHPPAFTSSRSESGQFITVLSGFAIYARNGNLIVAPAEVNVKLRYMELQVPCDAHRVGIEPTRLLVYDDSSKLELLDVIALGYGENRASVQRGFHRSESSQLPTEVVSIDSHALRFRCKEEASLWRVAFEDCIGCSRERWKELLELEGSAPRGYRTQYNRLKDILSSASCQSNMNELNVYERCLECIEYFQRRLGECQCRRSVDFSKEDLILETRQLLLTKLGKL